MLISYPISLKPAERRRQQAERSATPTPSAIVDTDSRRYDSRPRSRRIILIAVLISVGVHAGILFGFVHSKKQAAAPQKESVIALTIAMPNLKELEEPEPLANDAPEPPTDLATLVPMQADLPQLPRPDDFVQAINFASLIERPDFSSVSIASIPENFHGGRKLAESIGKIFTLDQLDRAPEAVFQAAPRYPLVLKREGQAGRVKVEFVVNTDGRVLDAQVVESSHHGFNEAAITAVSKWKFRPGIKSGSKVNTRMAVPIVFEVKDEID